MERLKPLPARALFKNAQIIDPIGLREYEGDILVIGGKIAEIGKFEKAPDNCEIYNLSGLSVSPGFVDMHAHLREPGREDEETITSGCLAAMAGGFTAVCTMPNTNPPVDNQEVVRFILRQAEGQLVDLIPFGSISKGLKGRELTEIGDMVEAGIKGVTDDGNPVMNAAIMRRVLEYSRLFDITVSNHSEDINLTEGGCINEGFTSTRLGLPGMPAIAESIMIYRDIILARYTGGRLHIPHVSTEESIKLIRAAKDMGVDVTCEVAPHHVSLTEEDAESFDANLKVNPPLRERKDIDALIEGLEDGTIDVISTDHAPHAREEKEMDFISAPFGIIGLETAFSIIMTFLVDKGHLSLPRAVAKLTVNPAKILRLKGMDLKRGENANMTIFDRDEIWTVKKEEFKSKSKNSPFIGWKLKGKIKGVINKNLIYMNEKI
ncbi:MAG: dihydroorotase [Fidelibacterota bacterium]